MSKWTINDRFVPWHSWKGWCQDKGFSWNHNSLKYWLSKYYRPRRGYKW